jgi:hypothetical protein
MGWCSHNLSVTGRNLNLPHDNCHVTLLGRMLSVHRVSYRSLERLRKEQPDNIRCAFRSLSCDTQMGHVRVRSVVQELRCRRLKKKLSSASLKLDRNIASTNLQVADLTRQLEEAKSKLKPLDDQMQTLQGINKRLSEKLRQSSERAASDEQKRSSTPPPAASLADKTANVTRLLTCPGDHVLVAFTSPTAGFTCDLCQALLPEASRVHGCRLCDWDACDSCFEARQSQIEFELSAEFSQVLLARQQSAEQARSEAKTAIEATQPETAPAPCEDRKIGPHFPSYWEPQTGMCQLFPLDPSEEEYQSVVGPFMHDLTEVDYKASQITIVRERTTCCAACMRCVWV